MKWVNTFQNHSETLEEILVLKLIIQIMQQNQISNISLVDTSSFTLKTNLASLKTEVDEMDIDKLMPVAVHFRKLSDVVKKVVYVKLVAKVNNIDTSGFALKTKYQTDKSQLGKKIPDISNLVKQTDYNSKVNTLVTKTVDYCWK